MFEGRLTRALAKIFQLRPSSLNWEILANAPNETGGLGPILKGLNGCPGEEAPEIFLLFSTLKVV